MNLHSAGFNQLPGIPNCCTGFNNGDGFGFSLGVLGIKPLSNDISVSARLSYNLLNGFFKVPESTTILIDGSADQGVFQHNLSAYISAAELSAIGSYKVWNDLSVLAGFKMAYLLSKSFSQSETIIQPVDRGTFIDGTREHNQYSGTLPNSNNINFGITIGAAYTLPLNKKKSLFVNPELFYTYYLQPVIVGLNWNIHTIRLGASVVYKEPPPPPPPPPTPIDPTDPLPLDFPSPPVISTSVAVIQIDSNNAEMYDFDIKIEDFISLNLRPLLNYIFFDEDSSSIPPRYYRLSRDDISRFNNSSLENLDVLSTYYQILNITGKRLSDNPEINIELVGTNSNINLEKDNTVLSLKRAENVRDYLRDYWGIDESRMKVSARNLPKEFSEKDSPEGQAENRRVEILASDNKLLEPVITTDTLRHFQDYKLRFFPSVRADAGLKRWNLKIKQGNKDLMNFLGTNIIKDSLDWNITQNDTSAPKKGGQIYYALTAEDSLGQTSSSPNNWIPVDQLTIEKKRISNLADKEYEYFSLILFDFGKSNLGNKHKAVLNFVKSRIKPESQITISGYTDGIGDEKINQRISLKRAEEAQKQLGIKNVIVKGVGETELLYDNLLPEGRFYCRTVKITIENPILNIQ